MFEKEAEEYAENREVCGLLDAISEDLQNYDYGTVAHYNIDPLVEECFKDGAEFGYNKALEEVKHDLMMKLKDEGIVKPLKDSIFRNERLSSQEQQELCAWIECAMGFGENLDECAKELTEAKDIIKELVKGIRITFEHRGFITNVDAFVSKAEQFLKEVEI